jgi:hypothetical protein
MNATTCASYSILFLAFRMGGYTRKQFYNCFGQNTQKNDKIIREVLQML